MNMNSEYLNEKLTSIRREELARETEAEALRRAARDADKGKRFSVIIDKLTR